MRRNFPQTIENANFLENNLKKNNYWELKAVVSILKYYSGLITLITIHFTVDLVHTGL